MILDGSESDPVTVTFIHSFENAVDALFTETQASGARKQPVTFVVSGTVLGAADPRPRLGRSPPLALLYEITQQCPEVGEQGLWVCGGPLKADYPGRKQDNQRTDVLTLCSQSRGR